MAKVGDQRLVNFISLVISYKLFGNLVIETCLNALITNIILSYRLPFRWGPGFLAVLYVHSSLDIL